MLWENLNPFSALKTFPRESLIEESLKHKLRIVLERNFGRISKLDHSSGFESERLMVESLRLLQNGFASLDIIRGAEADVPEGGKC